MKIWTRHGKFDKQRLLGFEVSWGALYNRRIGFYLYLGKSWYELFVRWGGNNDDNGN